MHNRARVVILLICLGIFAGYGVGRATAPQPTSLGAFSVGLNVKDIAASRAFYETLGFTYVMGDAAQGWTIIRNGSVTLGLFKGVWDRNVMTFNPGWDAHNQPADAFTDVRELQRQFKAKGLRFLKEAEDKGNGPASFLLADPDGNPVLFDQHVARK